ncbi:oligosaccharide flippase family protein [Microbacterium schleiferi]|uniref:oligosaccharide flippase family protein n=1 Tax=Microbacterium schleiferi TaxID=69362 RepID=UPI0035C7F612
MGVKSHSRQLSGGAAWNYLAQLLTIVIQLGYAAFTSRLVGPEGFGNYAVALSVSGLVGMVASGGLTYAAGRLQSVETKILRGLNTYALLIGAATAGFLLATAGFWAWLWGAAGASDAMRVLSIGAFLTPWQSLVSGIVLRLGRYRSFAATIFLANTIGMAVGAAAVLSNGTGTALAVAPVTTSLVCVLALHAQTRFKYFGLGSLGAAIGELRYSWNVTGSNLLSYISNTVSRWSVSVNVGPAALGQWNRAEAVSTVPFHTFQTAIGQVIFPQFRHDIHDPARARRIWPDLIALIAWVTFPAGCALAVLLPILIPILFGPGWDEAAALAPLLAIIAGIQPVIGILNSAVLAIGRGSWFAVTEISVMVVQSSVAVAVLVTRDLGVAVWGLLLAGLIQHAWQLGLCHHAGYVRVQAVLASYLPVAAFGALVATQVWLCVTLVQLAVANPLLWAALAAYIAVVALVIWRLREAFPPVKIARRYSLI